MDLDTGPLLMVARLISRIASYSVIVVLALWPLTASAGTCRHAYAVEGQTPPVFTGINTADAGFVVRYWAWGANPSDQGTQLAGLVDDGPGIALNSGILWANSNNCSDEIEGTGILAEAQTTDAGGQFVLLAIAGAEGNVDALQNGSTQCVAQAIPVPIAAVAGTGTDGFGSFVDFTISWDPPTIQAWQVSSASDVLAGYALYFRTSTPVNNGDTSQFTRILTIQNDTAPYMLDDSDTKDGLLPATRTACRIRLRPNGDHFFVLALIFDGTGDGGSEPQADVSAVQTAYVSASSEVVATSDALFADDFESGDVDAWSGAGP